MEQWGLECYQEHFDLGGRGSVVPAKVTHAGTCVLDIAKRGGNNDMLLVDCRVPLARFVLAMGVLFWRLLGKLVVLVLIACGIPSRSLPQCLCLLDALQLC